MREGGGKVKLILCIIRIYSHTQLAQIEGDLERKHEGSGTEMQVYDNGFINLKSRLDYFTEFTDGQELV